jgi:hypothetical protein
MAVDSINKHLFEMRLIDIYEKHSWLAHEMSQSDFIKLFPVRYKINKPQLPDKPVGFDLDRDVFLEVLLAFRQSFR